MKLVRIRRDSSVASLLQNDNNNKLEDKAISRPCLVILSESSSKESLGLRFINKIIMLQHKTSTKIVNLDINHCGILCMSQ